MGSVQPSSDLRVIESTSYQHASWEDITEEFARCCQELGPSELCAQQSFTLYDAMSAIELVDPKMDVGVLLKSRKIRSLKDAVEAGMLKCKGFSVADLLGIFDRSLSYVLLWTEGHCLAQTVFTLPYLQDLSMVDDEFLRPFCMALLDLVDHLRQIIVDAAVIEEEDFQMSTAYMLTSSPNTVLRGSALIKQLKTAEDLANKRHRSTKKTEGSQDSDWTAVALRFKFLRGLLHLLESFRQRDESFFTDGESHTETCTTVLDKLLTTNDYANESSEFFEPLLNVHLLPPSFPRSSPIPPKQKLFSDLKGLFLELRNVFLLRKQLKNTDSVLSFLRTKNGTNSRTVIRSMMQIVLDYSFGLKTSGRDPEPWFITPMHDFVADSIRQFTNAPLLLPALHSFEFDKTIRDYVDGFLKSCKVIFALLVKGYGFNRARQRDAIAAALTDIYALQDDAEKLDDFLHRNLIEMKLPDFTHQFCFGSWSLGLMLSTMEDYLVSGFELELYSEKEMHFVYWYLHDVTLHCSMQTLLRASTAARENEAALHSYLENETKRKNTKKKPVTRAKASQTNGTGFPHRPHLARSQSLHQLCEGFHLTLLGLEWLDLLESPEDALDCDEFRYYQRLLPFMEKNAPAVVDYEQYLMVKDVLTRNKYSSGEKDPQVLQELFTKASECFNQAQQVMPMWSKDDWALQVIKIAKRNEVITRILSTGRQCKSVNLVFEAGVWFPNLQLNVL